MNGEFFLIADCRVFHLGKEELGIMLNSGAVLQRSALFHLKMHPGQCQHWIFRAAHRVQAQKAARYLWFRFYRYGSFSSETK